VDGVLEIDACAELFDQLQRRPHPVKRRNLQDAGIVEVEHAVVLVLCQQGVEHRPSLRPVLGEYIPFAHVIGSLAAGERQPVKGHVADQIKRVQVLADFLRQRIKREPLFGELIDNGLLALGFTPAVQEVIQAGKTFP
jgi:hypothetical protein